MPDSELSFLLAEGDPRDALVVLGYLAEEQGETTLSVDRAATEEEALSRLSANTYDLVLLGDLREGSALSVLRAIRSGEMPPPVIVLTESTGSEMALAARSAGATDLLVKSSLRRSTLTAAVRYASQLRAVRRRKERAEDGLREVEALHA